MKQYFLQFDFFSNGFNKFWFGVVGANLNEKHLNDVCKEIIRQEFPGIDADNVTIKVNAFNNIEA